MRMATKRHDQENIILFSNKNVICLLNLSSTTTSESLPEMLLKWVKNFESVFQRKVF